MSWKSETSSTTSWEALVESGELGDDLQQGEQLSVLRELQSRNELLIRHDLFY